MVERACRRLVWLALKYWGAGPLEGGGREVEGMRGKYRGREHIWRHSWLLWEELGKVGQVGLGLFSLSNFKRL